MDKLFIIIPAYNEEENIENVINEWYPIIEQYQGNGESRLVIIDDGSTDKTYSIMRRCAIDRPLFVPVTRVNSGHGATVLYGYKYAIRQKADFIFQTDSDGQTLPEEFHNLWELRNQYDMIIGNRNNRQDGFIRVLVTKVLKIVIRLCFIVSVTVKYIPITFRARQGGENSINIPKIICNGKKAIKDFILMQRILTEEMYSECN